MSSLPDREKQLLLGVARRVVTLAAERCESLEDLPQDENLIRPAGAFVTLRRRGRLRGCIGQLASTLPLISVVAQSARAAALEDPRFSPVRPSELAEIEIELSVLSPMEDIEPRWIEAGKHGLMVSKDSRRGVLLPQVAREFRWTAERLLEETCVKAGLGRDAWKDPSTRIQAFAAEAFSESTLRIEPEAPGD
ncbi:MAG TPA: AmmeMemoRadiSam system protein A [Verrucomicrobiae bacterium]|jgi:AmmeMemoRadiSam system protein A|nr:AmmeMemoRadiSam system protein A [Verrucomicrobiae bacterium]